MGSNEIAEALGIPAGPSGLQSEDPYPLEVPIRVRGFAGGGNLGADSICEPFLEDTLTVLVSPRGAVLRLASPATPGQMLTLSSPRLGREMPARVIRYRGSANVKGYAEIEFAPEAVIPGATTAPASAAPMRPVPMTAIAGLIGSSSPPLVWQHDIGAPPRPSRTIGRRRARSDDECAVDASRGAGR